MKMRVPQFSRREFQRVCASLLLFGRRWAQAGEGGVGLTWVSQPDPAGGAERRYRADAQVILLSVPLLKRAGVGDGSAVWRESRDREGTLFRLLEFRGRSAPERAAGLNRFGMIQELSRTAEGACTESIYFGLMTASPEESVADAKKALHSSAKEAPYSAIEGRIAASFIETAGAHFVAPALGSTAEQGSLIERAREALRGAPRRKSGVDSGESPRPFLHALAGLLDTADRSQTHYTYNGRLYRLRIERSRDAKAAAMFCERGLIGSGVEVTRVSGSLERLEGGKSTEFRLWIEEGRPRPLPLRIEYQPKSYLRLTFEAQG